MRILHISTRLILGGSQENTLLSCAGQADAGHQVALAYGPIYGPEGSMLDEARAHGGVETIEIPNLVRQLSPVKDLGCRRNLRQLIEKYQPDVVHTHSSKAGILGRAAAHAAGVPAIVHTIHGLPFHPYQSALKNRLYVALEKWAARRCDAIVCVADAMKQQALAEGIGRKEQFTTIYSGMNTTDFLECKVDKAAWRSDHGLCDDDFVIGTVARLAELKGHDDLLDAMGEELRKDSKLKLLWIGDGYWSDRLKKRVRKLGLEKSVVFSGKLPPDEIPRAIRSMDVLAHPSWREGLPRTVPQALLSGVPVVANDVDGTREVVLDGRTGRLVRPGDIQGLKSALIGVRRKPTDELQLAEAGQELCRSMFPARRMIQDLEDLYKTILQNKRN